MIAFSSWLLGAMGTRGIGRLSKLRIAWIAYFIYIYKTEKMLINELVQQQNQKHRRSMYATSGSSIMAGLTPTANKGRML